MAKNSLVANINRRKKNGTSRAKANTTISKDHYHELQTGWGKEPRKRAAPKKTQST